MGEKYLQSKSGSLEDLATKIASKQSEVKVEQKVKLETPKTYLGLKENSVTAVAARVVSESLIKEEKFKADYTIEKRAPRHISDEEAGRSWASPCPRTGPASSSPRTRAPRSTRTPTRWTSTAGTSRR